MLHSQEQYSICSGVWHVINIVAASCGLGIAMIWFMIWLVVGSSFDLEATDPDFQLVRTDPPFCTSLWALDERIMMERASMVVLLTDGFATAGQYVSKKEIALRASAKLRNASMPVSVHGLAFGSDADLELLRLLSAASGGIASRILDGSSMDTQGRLLCFCVVCVCSSMDTQGRLLCFFLRVRCCICPK